MTDYNDGKWHGWNGGECPVHPETRVKAIEASGLLWEANAEDCDWKSFFGAFRVTKVHREPREFWVNLYKNGAYMTFETCGDALLSASRPCETIRVREVLDE